MTCNKDCLNCEYKILLKKNKNCFIELKPKINKEYKNEEIAIILNCTLEEIAELEKSAIQKLVKNDAIVLLMEKIELAF